MIKRAILLVLAMTALGAAAANAESASTATRSANVVKVGCDQIIGMLKTGDVHRVVLGVVEAPTLPFPGVVYVPQFSPFPYWRKVGMVIRASRKPVTVSVPRAWRGRARIGWGNPAPETTVVRFAACPPVFPHGNWNGYAGGFFLRPRSACVPLEFAVGDRRATVRFGLGQPC